MNEVELRRSRAVYKSLTVRLTMLKARLRTAVLKDDCLCLDFTSGRCSADGDTDMSTLSHVAFSRQLLNMEADLNFHIS
jgi:hypothetical protein